MAYNDCWKMTGPGKLFLDYGPMQIKIHAEVKGEGSDTMAKEGAIKAIKVFKTLCRRLDIARSNICDIDGLTEFSKPLATMIQSTLATGVKDATPMIAVAGTTAQLVTERLMRLGADKVVINNGGDISLGLTEGNQVTAGVITDIRTGKIEFVKTIMPEDIIRGIATSGVGGRSFTKGIASSVTVFAKTASQADACATIICNATNLDNHYVHKMRASDIDPNTDIPLEMVTTYVEELPEDLVKKALRQGKELAERYLSDGIICGAVLSLQGYSIMVPENIVIPIEKYQRGEMKHA